MANQVESKIVMCQVKDPKAYFTIPLPNGETRHVSLAAKIVWGASCGLAVVLIGVLAALLHLNSVSREYADERVAFTEYKEHKAEQESKIQKLVEDNEQLLRDMSELHALETKLRRAVIYTDGERDFNSSAAEDGIKNTDPNYLGQGGGHLDAGMLDVIEQQQINLQHEMERSKASLSELLEQIETRSVRGLTYPDHWPTEGGEISSFYGGRRGPMGGGYDFHPGIDIAVDYGTPVYAAASGTIEQAGWNGGYGRYVKINHGGGYETVYGHMSSLAVASGEKIKKGDVIGFAGSSGYSTGPHVHFEILVNGENVNPLSVMNQ